MFTNSFVCCIDWTQCTDANTGHPYYWNIVTKEVTWEMPVEYQHFLEHSLTINSNSLKKWILCYTDDNTPYYFNEVTREISWEKPDDLNQLNCYPQGIDPSASKRNESTQLSNGEHVSCILTNTQIAYAKRFNHNEASEDKNQC